MAEHLERFSGSGNAGIGSTVGAVTTGRGTSKIMGGTSGNPPLTNPRGETMLKATVPKMGFPIVRQTMNIPGGKTG